MMQGRQAQCKGLLQLLLLHLHRLPVPALGAPCWRLLCGATRLLLRRVLAWQCRARTGALLCPRRAGKVRRRSRDGFLACMLLRGLRLLDAVLAAAAGACFGRARRGRGAARAQGREVAPHAAAAARLLLRVRRGRSPATRCRLLCAASARAPVLVAALEAARPGARPLGALLLLLRGLVWRVPRLRQQRQRAPLAWLRRLRRAHGQAALLCGVAAEGHVRRDA